VVVAHSQLAWREGSASWALSSSWPDTAVLSLGRARCSAGTLLGLRRLFGCFSLVQFVSINGDRFAGTASRIG
jgi:hypothetical protein